jgi:hypothetical protein
VAEEVWGGEGGAGWEGGGEGGEDALRGRSRIWIVGILLAGGRAFGDRGLLEVGTTILL